MTTTQAELAAVGVATMGKPKHDRRDPATFATDLEREVDESLAKDPSRWASKTLAGFQRAGWREGE